MHIDRQIAIWAGWIAGPAFGVAMMAAPEYLKLEPLAAGLLFWGGIVVFLLTIIAVLFIWLHKAEKQKAVVGPILMMFFGALVFCGGAGWYFWPTRLGFVEQAKAEQDPGLFLECTLAQRPIKAPLDGRLFTLEIFPFPIESGGGGLGEKIMSPGQIIFLLLIVH